MKRFEFRYFLEEGIRSIFLHGFMSFASVSIITACLLIMGSFTLLVINVNFLIDRMEQQSEILAYIDDSLTEEQARALESQISATDNVSSCEFVTREQAMEDFKSQYEDSGLFQGLDASILRDRYKVYIEDMALMDQTKAALEQISGIASVNAHEEIAQGFISVRNIVGVVSIIIVGVLLTVSVFIMSNTIKLTTFDRREEIAIMRMVGAEKSFIRWPFVIQGLALGLAGAIVGFFCQWGIYVILTRGISDADKLSIVSVIPYQNLAGIVALVFLATGLLVGAGGSALAIRKFLRV